jgi:hypothetical protein
LKELVEDGEAELRAFRRLDPEPEHVLAAVGCDAEREVDGLVFNDALADLGDEAVEVDDGVEGLERARTVTDAPS